MTAVNLYVASPAPGRPGWSMLLTDQGMYHKDGTLLATESKIAVSQRLRAAVSVAGLAHKGFATEMAAWLELQPDQRTMLAGLRGRLQELEEDQRASQRAGHVRGDTGGIHRHIQLYVAMWALDQRQPEGYVIASARNTIPGLPRHSLQGVGQIVSPPVDAVLYPDNVADFDPRRDGLALIEAQRRTAHSDGNYLCAMAAELAVAGPLGVTTEILARWPDRIGAKVDPFAAAAEAASAKPSLLKRALAHLHPHWGTH